MTENTELIRKTKAVINDARHSVWTCWVPLVGLAYIFRLIQYYRLRPRVVAAVAEGTVSEELAVDLEDSSRRLWFAILFWPVVLLAIFLLLVVSLSM